LDNSIEEIEKQKAQAKKSLRKAEDLFQSLLQKAFKGELSEGVLEVVA
jgi:type I restriction enzyme S subunit